MLLYQEPVVALLAWAPMHAYQMPAATELFAIESEGEVALGNSFMRIVFRLPAATVPDHDGTAAIFTLGNRSLEFVVSDWMVLDLDCQPLLFLDKPVAARHRPALHDAVQFEAKIIVQAACGMLLNNEGVASFACDLALRLGGDAKAALGTIRF